MLFVFDLCVHRQLDELKESTARASDALQQSHADEVASLQRSLTRATTAEARMRRDVADRVSAARHEAAADARAAMEALKAQHEDQVAMLRKQWQAQLHAVEDDARRAAELSHRRLADTEGQLTSAHAAALSKAKQQELARGQVLSELAQVREEFERHQQLALILQADAMRG